jgi:integrase
LKNSTDREKLELPIQLIKNDMSKRTVPVHSVLVELGLQEYIDSCSTDGLFIENADNFGKESRLETYKSGYRTWFRKLKLIYNAYEGNKSFHSFRHTFLSKAAQKPMFKRYI